MGCVMFHGWGEGSVLPYLFFRPSSVTPRASPLAALPRLSCVYAFAGQRGEGVHLLRSGPVASPSVSKILKCSKFMMSRFVYLFKFLSNLL